MRIGLKKLELPKTSNYTVPGASLKLRIWIQIYHAYKNIAKDNTVLIFDSLKRFHTGEENSASDMCKIMGALRSLTRNGASVIVLHHRGKSEHSYRGSSDILAGVDVCYTLSKEGELLKLSCDEKNRFGEPFSLYLRINESETHFRFDLANSPKSEKTEVELVHVKNAIISILDRGEIPIQRKIVETANIQFGIPLKRIRKLLDDGEGKYWTVRKGLKNNTKIYNLLGDESGNELNKVEDKDDKAVIQLSDTVPPEKPENRKSKLDPWDEYPF